MKTLENLFHSLLGHVDPEAAESSLIITAQVHKIYPHPNADRLRLVSVNSGDAVIDPVICGANNFQEGDIVILALPGARITHNIHSQAHEAFILEKANIRGVESQGMLCSGFELGLRDSPETREEGVLILPSHTRLGLGLAEAQSLFI